MVRENGVLAQRLPCSAVVSLPPSHPPFPWVHLLLSGRVVPPMIRHCAVVSGAAGGLMTTTVRKIAHWIPLGFLGRECDTNVCVL